MCKSMTAYGRASQSTVLGRFVAEITSVNNRHLELHIYLPKELSHFEHDIRKLVSEMINRGRLIIKLNAIFDQTTPLAIKPNIALARQYQTAWHSVAKALHLPETAEAFSHLLINTPEIFLHDEDLQNESSYRIAIQDLIKESLKQLITMREAEGTILKRDIIQRLSILRTSIETITKHSAGAPNKYYQKLKTRIEEVINSSLEHEDRILREVAVYAERIDTTEEVIRFNSHLDQFDQLLEITTEPSGRTMDFLVQEMMRETNTLGSKSPDVEVTRLVVEMKGELERIREQIQNIE